MQNKSLPSVPKIFNATNAAASVFRHSLASVTLYDRTIIHSSAIKPFKLDKTQKKDLNLYCVNVLSLNLLSVTHTHDSCAQKAA